MKFLVFTNHLNFNVVFMLFLNLIGATLKCYKCTAPDQPSCIANQKEVECGLGTCMTLSYSQKEDGYTTKQYLKTCKTHREDCEKFCETKLPFYIKDCQVRISIGFMHYRHYQPTPRKVPGVVVFLVNSTRDGYIWLSLSGTIL